MARLSAKVRREEFLRAAALVIAEHGVGGATTRKIAEAADAPLAALHYCFDSKEALLDSLYEEQIKVMRESTWSIEPEIGLAETAAQMIKQLMDWYIEEPDFAQASGDLLFWSHHNDRRLGQRGISAALDVIEETLGRGVGKPSETKFVEPMATLVLAVSDGLLLQWLTFKDSAMLDEGVEVAVRAVRTFCS